ncbi:MAG TPA: histidine kinase [Vicinamibacterales bacterium]|nr:histidine kinase [Vicinamibacterales bacterium]
MRTVAHSAPMPDRRISWRVVLAVGAAYSVFAALVSYWFTRGTGLSLWSLQPDASAHPLYIISMNVLLWTSWAAFAPLIFELARRFRFDRQHWRHALILHLPASLVITAAHILVVATARYLLQDAWGVSTSWGPTVREAFFRTLDYELPVYWALLGLQHARDYYREVRAREVAAAHLETRLVEAQLQALQRQLHPHFLFNTLHAISALLHRDPERADLMIERLSDLLRITLDKVGVQEVTLAEELEYLRAYLDIEQVQFGDRLQVVYEIDAYTLDALVPNLVLQPLAENAIRHGLEPRVGRGRLTVRASRESETLRLQVIDNGRGMTPAAVSAANQGVGLSNTRSRLERLYGDRARLEFAQSDEGGVAVTIHLPFTERETDEDPSDRRRRSTVGADAVARAAV